MKRLSDPEAIAAQLSLDQALFITTWMEEKLDQTAGVGGIAGMATGLGASLGTFCAHVPANEAKITPEILLDSIHAAAKMSLETTQKNEKEKEDAIGGN